MSRKRHAEPHVFFLQAMNLCDMALSELQRLRDDGPTEVRPSQFRVVQRVPGQDEIKTMLEIHQTKKQELLESNNFWMKLVSGAVCSLCRRRKKFFVNQVSHAPLTLRHRTTGDVNITLTDWFRGCEATETDCSPESVKNAMREYFSLLEQNFHQLLLHNRISNFGRLVDLSTSTVVVLTPAPLMHTIATTAGDILRAAGLATTLFIFFKHMRK